MLHKLRIQWNYWRARLWWQYRNTEAQRAMLRPVISREHTRRQSGSGARQVPSGYDAQNDEIP
jgi:hypothetical protein